MREALASVVTNLPNTAFACLAGDADEGLADLASLARVELPTTSTSLEDVVAAPFTDEDEAAVRAEKFHERVQALHQPIGPVAHSSKPIEEMSKCTVGVGELGLGGERSSHQRMTT